MNTDGIFRHLEDNFTQDLEDIRSFLRQPSISYTGEGIRETGEWIIRWIELLGGTAKLVPVAGG